MALTPANIQNSFKKTGICPFNSEAVDPSNFEPSKATVNKHIENSTVDVTDFLKNKIVTPCAPGQRHCSKRKQIGGMVITEGEGKSIPLHLHTHYINKAK